MSSVCSSVGTRIFFLFVFKCICFFRELNEKNTRNPQFSHSWIPRDSLLWKATITLHLFKKGENFHWGSFIILGSNSVLSVLENGHLPDHRCLTTSVFLYDLCEARNGKGKTSKQRLCSFFRDMILQVRSGSSAASGISPWLQEDRKFSQEHLEYKDSQGDTISKYISNNTFKKTKHTHT